MERRIKGELANPASPGKMAVKQSAHVKQKQNKQSLKCFRNVLASFASPNYANDAKTFLKHFSDCLFYFCCTCADAWSRNKINGH